MASNIKSIARIAALTVLIIVTVSFYCLPGFAATTGLSTDGDVKKIQYFADNGCSVGIRFSAAYPFTFAGLEFNIGSNGGKVIDVQLYNWDTNMSTTLASQPAASVKVKDWTKGDSIGIYASDAGLSSFPAGEYYLRDYLVEGASYRFNVYTPCKDNVELYIGDYLTEGAPVFKFIHEGDPSGFLKKLSDRGARYSYKVPAETELSRDSEIVKQNIDSTLWNAVDGLGRTLPSYSDTGNKKDRLVGIFYWTWHNLNSKSKPGNLNQILADHPDAIDKYDHKVWKEYNGYAFFWNEPLFGYYTEMDDYVLRKHAELLADAGIDFVLFDCTNETLLFEDEFMNLLKVWSKAKEEGINVPKISFMLPFSHKANNNTDIKNLFYSFYKKGLYQDMWLYWEGKPVLMGIKDSLDSKNEEEADIRNFFTFRKGEPSYWLEDSTDAEWGWLHVYPQAKYYNEDGTVEQMTVGIAQNADYVKRKLFAMNGPNNMGRGYSEQKDYSYTYTYRGESIVCNSQMENAHYYGINFQEQWDYALTTDPEIVFVTGWNEWLVGRYEEWEGMKNAFPDQCNDANSRDIEPTKGELKDYYYYQLVANVRKYKGMTLPETYPAKTIDISKGAEQWTDVASYNHYIHNTLERDTKGFQGTKYYAEATRNDFKTLKASYDDSYFYFYAETVDPITPYTDADWIKLLLDTGAATKDSKDWEEFEYIIGRETGTGTTLALERSIGGWNWEKVADVNYTVNANVIQIAVPRSAVGVPEKDFSVGFKWTDNNLSDGDIMTLYTDGDSAPGGRFTFVLSDREIEEIVTETAKPSGESGCNGCGSFISAGSCMMFGLIFAAAAVLLRKKEN
ncbi:MAG: hypothetical protein J6112_00125 [Clostridia bacterium]|nr:hypothetical protein [Clostridia bacterium]